MIKEMSIENIKLNNGVTKMVKRVSQKTLFIIGVFMFSTVTFATTSKLVEAKRHYQKEE